MCIKSSIQRPKPWLPAPTMVAEAQNLRATSSFPSRNQRVQPGGTRHEQADSCVHGRLRAPRGERTWTCVRIFVVAAALGLRREAGERESGTISGARRGADQETPNFVAPSQSGCRLLFAWILEPRRMLVRSAL